MSVSVVSPVAAAVAPLPGAAHTTRPAAQAAPSHESVITPRDRITISAESHLLSARTDGDASGQ